MICNNCNTENPEGAVYCKNCGKRLDGKIVCPSCGEENPEDAKVCTQCGTQIAQSETAKEKTAGGWKKWVELAGGISAMAAVFCVLLCTFLTGVSVSLGSRTFQYHRLWYYFGDVWKMIKSSEFEQMEKAAVYMSSVYGLLISIGMIVSTLVFSILAAVRFGKKTAGKSNKDYLPCAIGAVMSFICGTALLVTLDAMSGEGASMIPNAAGIAGIVCGLVFLCGCLGCNLAIKDRILDKQSAMKLSFIVSTLVLLSLAAAFAAQPAAGEGDSFVNFFYCAIQLGYYSDNVVPFTFSLLAITAQIAALILAMAAIGSNLRKLAADEPKIGLKLPIWFTVVSALFLVFSVTALATSEMSDVNYAYIIVEFVFAVAALVETIVCKVVCKDKKTA